MATLEGNPGLGQLLHWKLGKVLEEKQSKTSTRTYSRLSSLLRLVLHLAGFSGLTAGAWVLHIAAGLAVAGISCFILSRLIAPESQNDNGMPPGYSR